MCQDTGYAYGDEEDCISYKCEGCGRRVRVTPAQARHFRGTFTACSRVCIMKAHAMRAQQRRLSTEGPEPGEGATRADALGSAGGRC